MSSPRRSLCFAAAFVLSACSGGVPTGLDAGSEAGPDAPYSSDAARDAGSDAVAPADAPSVDAAAPDAGPSGPCAPNATRACECDAGPGSQRCLPNGRSWLACACQSYGAALAVSPMGHDSAGTAGTLADPFLTLGRAQTAVRALLATSTPPSSIVVWVRGGAYTLTQSLALGATDSGHVTWSGYPGESARLVGGATIDPSAFVPLTSASPLWSRVDPSAQGHVLVADLHALGITDYGALSERGSCNGSHNAALELSVDGAVMPLARWPDPAENTPAQSETGAQVQVFGSSNVSPDVRGTFTMTGSVNGASVFTRNGTVGGRQYRLYRWTRTTPTPLTSWFMTTSASPDYPAAGDPFWSNYTTGLTTMNPSQGAVGTLSFRDPAALDHGFAQTVTVPSATQFTYASSRPARWSHASDVWLHGMFMYDWADCHSQATVIDTATQTVTLARTPQYGIAPGQPWYAENLLEEITMPGEWFLDRGDGKLYLWPLASLAGSAVVASMMTAPLVTIAGASGLTLRELTLEAGRAQLLTVNNSTDLRLEGLTLRSAGTHGASVSGGRNVGFSYAHVYGTGATGIALSGGDRPTLAASAHFVENSRVHDFGRWSWTYEPAVSLGGVGNRVSHNELYDAPHAAILYFSSNDQVIESNDIHDVCRYAADSGAIYSGRDWGARGNVIRNNYLHAIHSALSTDVHAIYLDDCLSGILVEGNVIDNVDGYGIEHGGGRDDLMVNNVLAHCGQAALHTDARCTVWRTLSTPMPDHTPGSSWDLLGMLEANHYQQDPWRTRYPACAAIPDDWAAITAAGSGWLLPQGSQFARNVGQGNGAWVQASDTLAVPAFADMSNNLPEASVLFVNEAAGDLSIAPGSPALSIPGFVPTPFASIGIQH